MTVVEAWSTERLAPGARLAGWSETLDGLHLDWELVPAPDRDVEADLLYRRTDDILVADVRGAGYAGSRQTDRDTADLIGVQLNLAGHFSLDYDDHRLEMPTASLFVWNSGLAGRAFDSFTSHREVTIMVPRAHVPRALEEWSVHSRPLATTEGTGLLSIAADQMRGIAREMASLTDRALAMSVDLLLQTLVAAVQPVRSSACSDRAALVERVTRFVVQRLDDPNLSVRSIASAHDISPRTLQTLFAESGESVGRFVRQQRLEHCRRDLVRADDGTTVTDVAFRWGFVDAAHFSRAFKKEFGMTPSSLLPRR